MTINWQLAARILCHLLAATPLLYYLFKVVQTLTSDPLALGADPVEQLMSHLGETAIYGLIITLSITPLQRALPRLRLIRYRRALGLWTFTYVSLHFCLYTAGINGFDFNLLLKDLLERPFIILGALGFVCLVPLAVTSTRGWQARLGARWRKLHQLIYVIALIALVHFFMQVRSDYAEFVPVALLIVGLLLIRWVIWIRLRRSRRAKLV